MTTCAPSVLRRRCEELGAQPEGLLRQCFECTGGVVRDHILWALLEDDWRRVRPTLAT